MSNFCLIIRGHERGSFSHPLMSMFCKNVRLLCDSYNYNLKIYIHVWNESEAKISHRPLKGKRNPISKETVKSYFTDFSENIESIQVDDDTKIHLCGNTRGMLGGIPLIAWKNMWYGIHSAVTRASDNQDPECPALCIRIDNFQNMESMHYSRCTANNIFNLIKRIFTVSTDTIKFIPSREETPGIDNCYGGKLKLLQIITDRFHYELDDVQRMYPNIHHQEYLVPYEARRLCPEKSSIL
ncbi:hypothetical protein TetV_265 [Tetraselmis virus 1]|uniref:Uncharacterized protein n=1 Tax=Tetraselmis virus 1 TaxID=2060617 RepID=A0A2P0VN63_9VIRU|nr:hypothetical protein QJ968_gp265 [Tetraselmis virus 1]AUF82357.1 hypothetical protein TetV_265 [Tetraselmis virus 1]